MPKLFTIVLLGFMLSSCISYHHDGTDAHEQSASLERGVTTAEWVYDELGKPRSSHTRQDGSRILHYQFDEEEETRIHLLLIINIHNKETDYSNLFIEIQDGVVEDYWQD